MANSKPEFTEGQHVRLQRRAIAFDGTMRPTTLNVGDIVAVDSVLRVDGMGWRYRVEWGGSLAWVYAEDLEAPLVATPAAVAEVTS